MLHMVLFQCMLGYFYVSIIHWTTGSLTCACDLFACVYTQGTSVSSLIQKTFVESVQNLTPEKSWSGHSAQYVMVTHPGSDHVRLCLTWLLRASARTLHCPLPIHLTQAGSYLPDKTLACSSDNLLRQIIMTRADLIVTVGICLVVLTCLMGT